jgi:hypothetical protein
MSSFEQEPWLVNLVAKLLHGDKEVATLLAKNPFPDTPPTFIRGQFYRYRLADPSTGVWWTREYVGPYFPPIPRDSPAVASYLESVGLSRSSGTGEEIGVGEPRDETESGDREPAESGKDVEGEGESPGP